jgi:hypothetical protein
MSEATSVRKRLVRFSEQSPETFEFDPDDCVKEEKWISKDSCERNKDYCQRLGRLWKNKGYDALLHCSYQNPSKDVQSKLDTFVTLGEADCIPRGLERYISAKHTEERKATKVRGIESVVDLCIYMRRRGTYQQDEIDRELCKLSAEHSRPARHFARRIALADSRAVLEDKIADFEDDMISIMTERTERSDDTPVSAPSNFRKPKKGLSFNKAKERTMRITKRFAGLSLSSGQR